VEELMTLPNALRNTLAVPAIGAPMFLVSFPPLVTALCRAGVVGAFPHVNARPSAQLDRWLTEIDADLRAYKTGHPGAKVAPHCVNLIVHRTNARYEPDLEIIVSHKVPLVITCLGDPRKTIDAVHGYGGVVLCDVINASHARKAIDGGADGLICVGGGAGGHASSQSGFSLVREVREFWDGCLVLGGSISDGHQIRAAEVLGADLAYMGTRFIATRESQAQDAYKQMFVDCSVKDIIYSDRFSGVFANFLLPSIARHGIDPETLPKKSPDMSGLNDTEARTWRDIWSAGHGIATIHDVPTVGELVGRLAAEYRAACAVPASPALAAS
jgi:nitronate monooxygenase